MIAAPVNARQETPPGECFLCAMDSQPCAVKKLEGIIISAREFTSQGETLPYITIVVGGELATLRLAPDESLLIAEEGSANPANVIQCQRLVDERT